MAKETLAICEAGFYHAPSGRRVDIGADLKKAKDGTAVYAPDQLRVADVAATKPVSRVEVQNETTFAALARLVGSNGHHVDKLVLGAWGCGVFRNDPHTVARIFAELLLPAGRFFGAFGHIAFAVFDRSENEATYRAFAERFKEGVS